jgi:hypothetical protein
MYDRCVANDANDAASMKATEICAVFDDLERALAQSPDVLDLLLLEAPLDTRARQVRSFEAAFRPRPVAITSDCSSD